MVLGTFSFFSLGGDTSGFLMAGAGGLTGGIFTGAGAGIETGAGDETGDAGKTDAGGTIAGFFNGFFGENNLAKNPSPTGLGDFTMGFADGSGFGASTGAGAGTGAGVAAGFTVGGGLIVFFGFGLQASLNFAKNPGRPEEG